MNTGLPWGCLMVSRWTQKSTKYKPKIISQKKAYFWRHPLIQTVEAKCFVFFIYKIVIFTLFMFFELLYQDCVCFGISQVFSTIKNHRIHVTTFFVLMTTIWWPYGVWKMVKFQNIDFFELPDQKTVCFDMKQV